MEALFTRMSPGSVGLGLVISLGIVLGGSSAIAEGLALLGSQPEAVESVTGGFTSGDLAQLEFANAGEATIARLAALGDDLAGPKAVARGSATRSGGGTAASRSDRDVFPLSRHRLSLLVARPDSDRGTAAPAVLSPGTAQPVGVVRSSLRSATPSERVGH